MNKFRDKMMRSQYDAAMKAYQARHPNLFLRNGERRQNPNYGSSFAQSFWMGFDGIAPGAGYIDKASRATVAYAYWRAGQDAGLAALDKALRERRVEGEGAPRRQV